MMSSTNINNSDESTVFGPSRISPWLILPPAFEGGDMVYKFYSLSEDKVVSINKRRSQSTTEEEELPDDDAEIMGSSHGCLALFNDLNCHLLLSNPLSHRHIKLPPIHTLDIPRENLRHGSGCVDRVIISGSPVEEECCAIMIFCPHCKLAFCRPGRSTRWAPMGALWSDRKDRQRCYDDFVYSSRQKLFFCLTEIDSDELEGWDPIDPNTPRLVWLDEDLLEENYYPWLHQERESSELKFLSIQLRYLVFAEQSNQLFLVTRHLVESMGPHGPYLEEDELSDNYPYKTVGFDVHKINGEGEGRGKLSYVEGSLDGLAMFVGVNHSVAVPAAEFPELKPNSIYFADDKQKTPPKWYDEAPFGGHDIGIFDYTSRTISPCYYPSDVLSMKRIMPPPMWFTPTLH